MVDASASLIASVEAPLQKAVMNAMIGAALLSARKMRKLPAVDIANKLGVKVQAIYNWEKQRNNPSTENIVRVADILKVDASQLMKGQVVPLPQDVGLPAEPEPVRRDPLPPSSVALAPDAPPFRAQAGRLRDVPELGIAVGGEDGDFDLNGDETLGYVPRPPALVGRDVFAVRVKNDSMSPRFREGDLLYVERRREPRPGDDAVIEFKQTKEGEPGRAFIKELVSKGMATVVVAQHNPKGEITFKRSEVKALYRVVPLNELFGV